MNKLETLINQHNKAIKQAIEKRSFKEESIYLDFYWYFIESKEMPYGVAKARDEDPEDWKIDKLETILKGG